MSKSIFCRILHHKWFVVSWLIGDFAGTRSARARVLMCRRCNAVRQLSAFEDTLEDLIPGEKAKPKGEATFLSDVTQPELDEMVKPGKLRKFLKKFVTPVSERDNE